MSSTNIGRRNPTTRFTDRVENYVKYRPGYPDALREALVRDVGLSAGSRVADIGSGTGISTDLLRQIGCEVYAIEPNAAMRGAAESRFAHDPHVHSIDGRAEATTLPDASMDTVTAGQSFHWFDREAARREFARILKPGGQVALFWNVRWLDGSPFANAYEQLLEEFGTDYKEVSNREMDDEELRAFFGEVYHTRTFPHAQTFDFEAVRGRLLSSSYAPGPNHPKHDAMLDVLRRLFDAAQEDGRVRLPYKTELYFGPLRV
jgi:ubiquinone/menaquinone biosynthesis C-methylase UbiE